MKVENFLSSLVSPDHKKEEAEQYSFLYKRLQGEEKDVWRRYNELSNLRNGEEIKAAYEYGFKTAVKLLMGVWKE